jgi:hypothetical protein
MNIISLSNNLDSIHRTTNNIPEHFNWKLYVSIIKNPSLYNVSLAYNHYIQHGQFNPNVYKLFWRTVYDIPNNFNEDSYKKYLEEKCKVYVTFKTNEDLYKFYHYTGYKLYPLNDQYSRTHFNIPYDFNDKIYVKLYPEAQLDNINMIYNFYNNNQNKCPLNDEYYKLLRTITITNNFNLNLNYDDNNIYKQYGNFGKKIETLNTNTNTNTNKNTNTNSKSNISNIKSSKINSDFLENLLFNNFDLNFETIDTYNSNNNNNNNNNINNNNINNNNNNNNNNITIKKHEITEEELNAYNNNKQNFDFKTFNKRYNFELDESESKILYNDKFYEYPLDETYYRLLYNIPNEFKETHISSFKILYNLSNSKSNMDIYKYYNNMSKFNNKEKDIDNYIDYTYIEKFIDKNIIFYNNIFLFNFINNKIKLEYIYNIYLDNPSSKEGEQFVENYNYLIGHNNYLHSEFLKKKFFLLKPFVDEYFKQNELKLISEGEPPTLVPLCTTFYYNYNFTDNRLFAEINMWEPFFDLYKKEYYYNNLFKKIKTPIQVNDEIELVYLMFDNYTHNYVSLMETLFAINDNYKINIYTTLSISNCIKFNNFIKTISSKFRIYIKLIDDNLTFNKFNNEILFNINFWKKFTSTYIVLFNSLAILKEDILSNITLKNDFIGFKYNKSMFSNYINYNFTIRHKNKMIELLEKESNNLESFSVNKDTLCIFTRTFNLDKSMECFIHSDYFNKNNEQLFVKFLDDEVSLINIINTI